MPLRHRLTPALSLALALCGIHGAHAQDALPTKVPPGTKLVFGDQSERAKTVMQASGEAAKLAESVSYANFQGGPAILEAFRAGAVDIATVGSTPPIQAQAAGENIPIVAARETNAPSYTFVIRPGLKITGPADFRGKKIAYAEGTARQPFVLSILKLGGLTNQDVTLVPMRVADFPDSVRSGQVDIAELDEPQASHYRSDPATKGSSTLSKSVYERLPHGLYYLYASAAALRDPAKAAAIRDYVAHWIAAEQWAAAHRPAWIKAYYIDDQGLTAADGKAVTDAEGQSSFPTLSSLVGEQQQIIDLIYQAGDIPTRLDAKQEFDFRFDRVIEDTTKAATATQ